MKASSVAAAVGFNSPGDLPELAWLPVAKLRVDARYQRSLAARRSQRLIAELTNNFRWVAFQAILAVPDGDGWLLIDGQHRVEAARRRGIEHVPAVVVSASSLEDQAEAFVRANTARVALTAVALFHARLAAREGRALAAAALLKEVGLEVPRTQLPVPRLKPWQTVAISSIERIACDPRDVAGREALKMLRRAFPDDPRALSALLVRGVSRALTERPGRAAKVEEALRVRGAQEWLQEYRGVGGPAALARDLLLMTGG